MSDCANKLYIPTMNPNLVPVNLRCLELILHIILVIKTWCIHYRCFKHIFMVRRTKLRLSNLKMRKTKYRLISIVTLWPTWLSFRIVIRIKMQHVLNWYQVPSSELRSTISSSACQTYLVYAEKASMNMRGTTLPPTQMGRNASVPPKAVLLVVSKRRKYLNNQMPPLN